MFSPSHDDARRGGAPCPSFRGPPRDGPLDVRSLRLALLGHEDAGVVLELDLRPVRAAERPALADDDGPDDLAAHLRRALLHGHDQQAADPRRGRPPPHPVVPRHIDDLHDARPCVVDALQPGALGQPAGLAPREAPHDATPGCFATATKETVFASGRHSMIVTRSPAFRPRQGGRGAWNRGVRVSERSNVWRYRRYSRSTTTVRAIRARTTVPSKSCPRTLSFPWNGQWASWQDAGGAGTSMPMSLAVACFPFSAIFLTVPS